MTQVFEFIPGYLPEALLTFVPGVVGLAMFIYVWFRIPGNVTAGVFLVFVASCSVWQISEGFLRIARYEEGAVFWNHCISVAIIPIVVSGLHFALLFTNQKKLLSSRLFMALLYLPGLYFFLSLVLGFTFWNVVPDSTWNWKSDPELSTHQKIETAWIFCCTVATMYALARYAYDSRNGDFIIKRRSLLLCIGYLIPAITAVIFQIIFPQVFNLPEIPIGSPAIISFSIASFIALKKYRLFHYNSRFAANKVLGMMNEGVLIVDTDLKVRYVNSGFTRLTGYPKNELIGKCIDDLGPGYIEKEILYNNSETAVSTGRTEKRILTRDGSERIVFYNHSAYTERSGEITGTIVLYTDITEIVKSNEKIKNEKRQALQYQSMLLSAQLNPHFVYNSLNSIQYYILEEKREPALVYVSEFSKLMRKVLHNSLKEYITLSDEIIFLEAYLNLELKRLENKFSYIIDVCPETDTEELLIPPMLLQPYIENSIIHGLGMITYRGILKISFKTEESRVICRIEDNGVGRERAEQMKEERKGNIGKSHGMSLTKTRIEVLQEISEQEHIVTVEDLKDENGVGTGTRIMVYFPKVDF